MKKKCFVAVSGGVDSAVALMLLKKEYDAEGITMIPFGKELIPDCENKEAEDARFLCEKMQVPHHILNLSKEFYEKVIGDFLKAYEKGETPNPCVVCNRYLKFGALLDYSLNHGGEEYATGHYVRVKQCGDRRIITRAADPEKDQSYVLWSLTQEQVSRFIAPLGEYSKAQVREMAMEMGLHVAQKGDSQDICFIPDGDYRSFLERIDPNKDHIGNFILTNGEKLGKHKGQRNYTIGQRKGLGIAYKHPLYVIGRDMKKNTVILGDNDALFTDRFTIRKANFSAMDLPQKDFECQVRIRYRAPFVKARLSPLGEGRFLIQTSEKVRAVTPGQSAVFYDGDTLLGGGVIEG